MRLSLLALLLLTSASPVLAAVEPPAMEDQLSARSEPQPEPPPRQERDVERVREAPAAPMFERRQSLPERDIPDRPSLPSAAVETPDPIREVARAAIEPRRDRDDLRPAVERPRDPVDGVAGWRWREREAARRGRNRDLPPAAGSPVLGGSIPSPETIAQPSREVSAASTAAPPGERPTYRDLSNRIAAEGWRQDWRRDRRYDWRRHRDRDRDRFHLGIYIDPFGWNRRDWDIGWRLPSRFYSSRYWIRDPWYYRLPPVYGPFRWIRYHGDVLLVDLRSGRVIDRIRYFFW